MAQFFYQLRHQLQQISSQLQHPGDKLRRQTQDVDMLSMRLNTIFLRLIQEYHLQLAQYKTRLVTHSPLSTLKQASLTTAHLSLRLQQNIRHSLSNQQKNLGELAHRLDTLSPLSTLQRGYAIIQNERNQLIADKSQTQIDDQLIIRLRDGRVYSRVEKIE